MNFDPRYLPALVYVNEQFLFLDAIRHGLIRVTLPAYLDVWYRCPGIRFGILMALRAFHLVVLHVNLVIVFDGLFASRGHAIRRARIRG
jgi:hypothetical protein